MLEIIVVAATLLLDLWTKSWAQNTLLPLPGHTMPLIQDVFHLTYVENRGAAFSILQGQRTFFLILTPIMLVAVTWFLLRNRKNWGPWLRVGAALLLGGAAGNGYDRLVYGYVRDIFDFRAIHFPVFNIADSALTVAVIMLAVYILFWDKKDGKAKENAGVDFSEEDDPPYCDS